MSERAVDLDAGIGRKEINRIRGRFLDLSRQRLARVHTSLQRAQTEFLELLPLLLHVNHPLLPGFVSTGAPAGIYDFDPSREQLMLGRRYAKGLLRPRGRTRRPPIDALYLMGSVGSIGQAADSDLDIWLCHAADLQQEQAAELADKARRLEEHAAGIGLTLHFYLLNAGQFRTGTAQRLSNESSGAMQHKLLLEEFYRTAIRLAGKPLLWWLVPPAHEDAYDGFAARLVEQRFINPDDWLDFGGLQQVPLHEFAGAAYWLLFKGIDTPYKALLKLILFESYAVSHPAVDWVATVAKRCVYGGGRIDVNRLDPYRLLLEHVETYLLGRGERERLRLVQRAFYVKTGQSLSLATRNPGWRREQLVALTHGWGWDRAEWLNMDSRDRWQLARVLAERNALVVELTRSFQLLTSLTTDRTAEERRLDPRELALLGRKLYSALERRPGKIDSANPGITTDPAEPEVHLLFEPDQGLWRLLAGSDNADPLRSSQSLVEILAWLHINGVVDGDTRLQLDGGEWRALDVEAGGILRQLRRSLPGGRLPRTELQDFARAPRIHRSMLFIDVGEDPFAHLAEAGLQLISERVDPLSFGAAHTCLVRTVDHLYVNSWGEAFAERHPEGAEGLLEALCRHLNLGAAGGRVPRPPSAHMYSSARGHLIAQYLEELFADISGWFAQRGRGARYILRAGDAYYQLGVQRDSFRWIALGGEEQLLLHLAEPLEEFSPCRIAGGALPDSPLPLMLEDNLAATPQVFYQVQEQGIAMYLLDEHGALFRQYLAGAEENHFLLQQQRFFDTLRARQITRAEPSAPPMRRVSFRRILRADGNWSLETVHPPQVVAGSFVELVATTNGAHPWRDGFTLLTGSTEFSSLNLGERLAETVVRHLVAMRHNGKRYPIYLTGVVSTALGDSRELHLGDAVRFKFQLENRFAQAMRELD